MTPTRCVLAHPIPGRHLDACTDTDCRGCLPAIATTDAHVVVQDVDAAVAGRHRGDAGLQRHIVGDVEDRDGQRTGVVAMTCPLVGAAGPHQAISF